MNQRRKAEELLDLLNLQAYRDKRVGALPYGTQKLIEVTPDTTASRAAVEEAMEARR